LRPLKTHSDDRGEFTEVHRREWPGGVDPVQWNCVRSRAGTLRGVHVHARHADYLTCPVGVCFVGLRDLRRGPTAGRTAMVELSADRPAALTIPPGVAHGFYFPVDSLHLYGVDRYFDPADELGCHWADPALELDWPGEPTLLSPRDRDAGSLAELLKRIEEWQPFGPAVRAAS
jgi:dTDP-4-dehydrorhamnose 3,5-epimerase